MTPSTIREAPDDSGRIAAGLPHLALTEWMERVPGLVAGVTTGGDGGDFDLGLFAGGQTRDVLSRWETLAEATGASSLVHARQVHEANVLLHRDAPPGLRIAESADGHVTGTSGTLLTVSIADCVPVFLLHEETGTIAAVHAGWRGTASGILEIALDRIHDAFGVKPEGLRLHLGPSICGECYEVGPEVFEALGRPAPDHPTPIDLPGVLLDRAIAAGIDPDHCSRSAHCTLCGDAELFSHRGGSPERQMAFIGRVGLQ